MDLSCLRGNIFEPVRIAIFLHIQARQHAQFLDLPSQFTKQVLQCIAVPGGKPVLNHPRCKQFALHRVFNSSYAIHLGGLCLRLRTSYGEIGKSLPK